MKSLTFAVASANLAAMVAGHGLITSPTPRPAGDALAAACGEQAYYMRSSDPAGNVQGELQVEGSGSGYDATACHVWLCAGHQFADNPAANIQSYTAGQTVAMKFEIKAPHTGVANVSIVDTATGLAIGDPLISWSDFADNSVPTQADQESFSITIPTDLGDACSTAGACVIQHYWNAASISQTYESCVDFTVSGSGSSGSTSSSSSSAVAASSTVATSSSSTEASTSTTAVSTSVAAVSSVATSTSSSADVTVTVSPVPVSSSVTSVAAVSTSASASSSTKKSCTKKASSTAATSTAVTISSSIGVDSTTTSVATTLATSAATTAVTTSATAATATSSAAATSTGTSTTGSSGDSTIEELIDLIIDLLEALLGTSTTTKKMKRSHSRDLRSLL